MTGDHRQMMQDRVPQARVYKVWNVPQYGSADATYLGLAEDILATGKASRLYQTAGLPRSYRHRAFGTSRRARDRRPDSPCWRRPSRMAISPLSSVVDEELARFLASGPTAAELERVKTDYRAASSPAWNGSAALAARPTFCPRRRPFSATPPPIALISSASSTPPSLDLRNAAPKWLSDGDYVLDVVPLPGLYRQRGRRRSQGHAGDRHAARRTASLPPSTHAAERAQGRAVAPHAIPMVQLSMLLDAGFATDKPAAPGTASMAMAMLDQGTPPCSAARIADALAALGADLGASEPGSTWPTVSLTALRDKLDPALGLYTDVILHPAFPAGDLARDKQNDAGANRAGKGAAHADRAPRASHRCSTGPDTPTRSRSPAMAPRHRSTR